MRKDNILFLRPSELFTINNLGYRGQKISINKGKNYRIVAIGDSSTFGHFLDYDESYPAILENHLNKKKGKLPFQVINAGIPGADSFTIYHTIKRTFKLLPDIYLIYIGANDLKLGRHRYFSENIKKALSVIKKNKKKVALLTYPYRASGRLQTFYNEQIRKIAQETNTSLIDLERIISKDKFFYRYFFSDGVHPNLKGNKKIAEVIFKELSID